MRRFIGSGRKQDAKGRQVASLAMNGVERREKRESCIALERGVEPHLVASLCVPVRW